MSHSTSPYCHAFAHPQILWLLLVLPPALIGFLLVVVAQAPEPDDAVHPGAAAAGSDFGLVPDAAEDSRWPAWCWRWPA